MSPEDTLRELVEAGLFAPLPQEAMGVRADDLTRWHRAVSPPKLKDLPWYVSCLKTLGAHSVEAQGRPGHVQLRTGDKPHEVWFRLYKDKGTVS